MMITPMRAATQRSDLTELAVPFLDTSAAQLRFSLTHAPVPYVARRVFGPLDLRVIGASHQVLVTSGRHVGLVETIACLPGIDGALPEVDERPGYRMTATVTDERVQHLDGWLQREGIGPDGATVLARFPGDPSAITALRARVDDDACHWWSWHVYPQHGQVVRTHTVTTEREGTVA